MTKKTWDFNLDSADIDACVETIQNISRESIKDASQSGAIAFSMEMMLLNFQKHFGSNKAFNLEFVDRFGKINFYIKLKGDSFDPRVNSQNQSLEDEFSSIILDKYSEDAAEYKYEKGINIIHRAANKKSSISSSAKMFIGFVLGIILGFVGQNFSANTQESLTLLFDTINGIILDLIVMGATMVVFLMVINSISGFGNISTVKKTGSYIIKRFLYSYLFGILIFIAYIAIFFDFSISDGKDTGTVILTLLTETVANIFPQSSISPFLDCDFLQIIFLASIIGIAILVIGDKAQAFRDFCISFETVANQILDWFCGMLPLFIFTMIPPLVWSNQLAEMAEALIQLVGITASASVLFIIRFVLMCIDLKASPIKAFSHIKPVMLRGVMTGSSTASITQIQDSIRAFNVKDSFNSFATAIGLIFEVVAQFLGFAILSFYLVITSNIPVSISTIISIIIICILLSIAAPPVNGGAIAIEFIIAGMLGVPDACLAVVPPIMLLFDFIATGLRCGGIVTEAVASANKMQEINT